jgi:ABC transporter substrate binding protein
LALRTENCRNRITATLTDDNDDLTFAILVARETAIKALLFKVGGLHVPADVTRRAAFAKRLGELGWVEGRSITIEYRWAEGVVPRAGDIAADYARQKVDVIVISGDAQVLAAERATADVPIVIAAAADPVGNGLVESLARPGGNVTGLSRQLTDSTGKWIENPA